MLLRSIEIPNYIRQVTLSNKRRAKYYTKDDELPKKFTDPKFDKKGRLLGKTGLPVIRNVRTVGKPRLKTINGQELYSGLTMPFVRSTMVRQIKESFAKHLKKVLPLKYEDFPVKMCLELHDIPKDGNWDLDNKWIYTKCLLDALKQQGIIPDDSIRYITASPGFEYHPIAEDQTPKLVLKIYKDDRQELLKTQLYNELYGTSEEW